MCCDAGRTLRRRFVAVGSGFVTSAAYAICVECRVIVIVRISVQCKLLIVYAKII